MNIDREMLLRYLEGSLAEADVEHVENRLATDEYLRGELAQLRSIGSILSDSRAEGFSAFFAERIIKQLHRSAIDRALPLYEALKWVFVRTATAGLAIAILLGVLNVLDYQGLDLASSWLEAAFGLPSTTVEDAFTYGVI